MAKSYKGFKISGKATIYKTASILKQGAKAPRRIEGKDLRTNLRTDLRRREIIFCKVVSEGKF